MRKGSITESKAWLCLDIKVPDVPPRYTTLCQWPERGHDLFRDALLSSPLAGVASKLMEDRPVRVMNTIVMGSSEETIIPRVPLILSHTPPLFKALINMYRQRM